MDTDELRKVDLELVAISQKLSLVNQLEPTNYEEEIQKFRKNHFYNPNFQYPKFEKEDYEERLNSIITTNGPMGRLFESSKVFLLKSLHTIQNRGTEKFTDETLYGKPNQQLVDDAYTILNKRVSKAPEPKIYTSAELKNKLKQVIDYYEFKGWNFVLIPNLASNINVSPLQKTIYIRSNQMFSYSHMQKLKFHEIGTHVLRSINGMNQDYKIFASEAIPGYLSTEEGLAAINEEKAGVLSMNELKTYAGRVVAINVAEKGSFSDIYKELSRFFDEDAAINFALRAKRGTGDTSRPGCFFKDYVYLKGMIEVANFVKNGGDLAMLYAGKIGIRHLDLVKKQIIKPPKYLLKINL